MLGTGYLGATHAVAMAELGFEVVGVDTDPDKVAMLDRRQGAVLRARAPRAAHRQLATGRLRFTTDVAEAVGLGGRALRVRRHPAVQAEPRRRPALRRGGDARRSRRNLTHDALIVGKSTVPSGRRPACGSSRRGGSRRASRAELVWNPEFLREGKAVQDTLHPDRIVLGGTGRPRRGARCAASTPARSPRARPVVVCDLPTAELVKVSANAFLATKISFINAISGVCEAAGADVTVLADALGHDVRIGRQFLDAGLGFGGGCLPKDIRALMHRSNELGAHPASALLQQVDEINMGQRSRVIDLALEACGGSVLNRRIGVLGAAFKPHTDDVRDSPALNVAAALHLRGAQVTVYDPQAGDTARSSFPTLGYATSVDEAVEGTDVVLVLTEWDEFPTRSRRGSPR